MTKEKLFVEKALRKMFDVIGVEYSEQFINDNLSWYRIHSWDEKQIEKFKKWFIKEIQKDLKISKSLSEKEFTWFNFNYGWRQKMIDKRLKFN